MVVILLRSIPCASQWSSLPIWHVINGKIQTQFLKSNILLITIPLSNIIPIDSKV